MSTLLSNKIRKGPNQEEQTESDLAFTRRKGREEGKKGSGSLKVCHFHKEGHWKNDCKYRQEEASCGDRRSIEQFREIKVLIAFYEDNTSQGKS